MFNHTVSCEARLCYCTGRPVEFWGECDVCGRAVPKRFVADAELSKRRARSVPADNRELRRFRFPQGWYPPPLPKPRSFYKIVD